MKWRYPLTVEDYTTMVMLNNQIFLNMFCSTGGFKNKIKCRNMFQDAPLILYSIFNLSFQKQHAPICDVCSASGIRHQKCMLMPPMEQDQRHCQQPLGQMWRLTVFSIYILSPTIHH